MNRETGHYWVKLYDIWMIAFYVDTTKVWHTIGNRGNETDSKWQEIDEKKIIRK